MLLDLNTVGLVFSSKKEIKNGQNGKTMCSTCFEVAEHDTFSRVYILL